MLQQIRDSLTGWVTWFIVGLIVVPFAFWGIESFKTGGGDPVIVKVGDQKIQQSQFRAAYDQRYQQMQAMLGANFRADQFDQKRFQQAVLSDLEQESMLRQYAHAEGYRATDAALFNYLSTIPAFQDQGKFNTETYKSALSRIGKSPQVFEDDLRDALVIEQMREAVIQTSFLTDAQAEQLARLVQQQRWLSYGLFDSAKYRDQVQVSDEQVKARYEQDKSKYMAPERIKLAYVELSLDSLPKAQAPTDDVLKVLYDAEKDSRFSTAEQRRARHILINFGADKAKAKEKIEKLAAQLKAGASFEQLAKDHSDDSGSKAQGGELGWIQRGQMVEKFEKKVYALKAGETSEPVETEFGWHLIQLEEIKPASTQPFSSPEVRQQLVELYQTREQQRHFQEKSEKLEQLVFENPASLDVAAKDLGLTIQTTDWLTRAGGPGIGANEAVKQAAFSTEVVKDGDNSKPINIGDNRLVAIRKAEYEAPRQKPLEEVIETVRADAVASAAQAKAKADAVEVLTQAKAGTPLAEAIKAKGIELQSPGLIKRDDKATDRQIVQALFKLARPEPGKTQFGEVDLANGSVAVIALSAVQDGGADAADAEVQRLRGQMRDMLAGSEFGGFRESVAKEIKVKVVNPLEAATVEPKPEL